MSLTFKLLSLVIRTAAKPIGNYIKKQAKDHDGFRRFAISQAQRLHRIDMRMRLGILHDPAAQQRMHEREQRAADEKKRQAETPIVRTEEEQKKHDDEKAKAEKDGAKKEEKPRKVQIRPLSDARAIELGANFFSEAFIFAVAAGLLIWDSWRSRRKESQRRDDVAERLHELESEVAVLRSKVHPGSEDVDELIERIKEAKEAKATWWRFFGWRQDPTAAQQDNTNVKDKIEQSVSLPVSAEKKTEKATAPARRETATTRANETDKADEKPSEGNKPSAVQTPPR